MANLIDSVIKNYRTAGHPTAFSSPNTVKRVYGISTKKANKILNQIDSYTLHREYKKPQTFNPYYVFKSRKQVHADLIDVRNLKETNNNFSYLLLLIDIFSRKVWVYPLIRKTGPQTKEALNLWLNDLGTRKPELLVTDSGTEFVNQVVKTFLASKNIEHRLALGTSKACFAERANKSIQVLLYKYMSDKETTRYIDKLNDLVKTYNTRGHRSLNYMTPNEADKVHNTQLIRAIQVKRYGKLAKKRRAPKYKIGDTVRVKIDAKVITQQSRAYARQFKGEYFKIVRVNRNFPIPMYYIQSWDTDEIIRGGFYENELQPVSDEVFKIEREIRTRGRGRNKQSLVKWKYFGDRHNSWVPSSDVTETFAGT